MPPEGVSLRQAARRLFLVQCAVAAAAALLFQAFADLRMGVSAALGGGVAALGTAVFALLATRVPDRADARQMARAFYRAEGWKLLLTVAAFAGIFLAWDVSGLALIAGYVAAALVYWLALLRM